MGVWNKVRNYGEYTQKNLEQADKRGGLWRSLNYHVYTPRSEVMNDQGVWHSIRYGKSFKDLYDTSFSSPNKLPRDANNNIDYVNANPILEKILSDKEKELNIKPEYKNKPKRSIIDRLIDAINIGQYTVMGALYNATDKNAKTKWYEGALKGLKSANPIGEDYKEYEKSFGDVLDNLGWKKEKNPDGKWYKPWTWSAKNTARNITSLSGDIFLDPLNYLSLGTKELLSGTGKRVGKEIVEETSEQTAKQILKEVGDKATTENVDEIIRQLDNLKGIKKGGRGISYGLQNVPFLNKIGGGKYNKTIVDADTIRKFSDDIGIGRITNQLTRGLKESKIGRLFNNVDLQQLARLDDVEAGKVLKFIEKGYGNNIELIRANIDTIEWVDKNLAKLPVEKQELITDLLENPTKWRYRKYKIDFGDTELGKEFKEKINKFLENATEDAPTIKGDKVKNIVDVLDGKKTIEEISTTKPVSSDITYDDIVNILDEAHITWKNYRKFYDKSNYDNIVQLAKDSNVTSKFEKVRMLNDAVFGGKEVISPIANQHRVNELYDMLTDGVPFDKLAGEIDKSYKSSLNARGVEIHDFLRNKFGYKNYREDVLGKIDKYRNKIDKAVRNQLSDEFGYSNIPPRIQQRYDSLFKQMQFARDNRQSHLIKPEHIEEFKKLGDQIDAFNSRYAELMQSHPDYKNLDKYLNIKRDREFLSKELFRMKPKEFKKFMTDQANKKLSDLSEFVDANKDDVRDKFVMQQEIERQAKKLNSPIDINKIRNDLSEIYFNQSYDDMVKSQDSSSKIRLNFLDKEVRKKVKYLERSHADAVRYKQSLGVIDDNIKEKYALKNYQPLFSKVDKPISSGVDVVQDVIDNTSNQKEVVDTISKMPKQLQDKIKDDLLEYKSDKIIKTGNEFIDVETGEILDKLPDADTNFLNYVEFKNNQKKVSNIINKNFDEIIPTARNNINEAIKNVAEGTGNSNDVYNKIKAYQEALTDKEVFEQLARFEYGDDVVDKATTRVRDVIVNGKTVDEQVIKITEELANLFDDMAVKEMKAGVLSHDKFIYNYVYHMLTPEGKKFVEKPKNKHLITDMFGFGNKFNVHNLDRKYEGTIKEINAHMKEKYGVDKFFETEISNIYLARALKHNEVMYDAKFTNEMFKRFGKKINHVSQLGGNDRAVISYHDLKRFTYKLDEDNKVKLFQKLGIADDVLDEYVTPLIELTPDQVKRIGNYAPGLPMYGVNNIMVDKANRLAKIQKAKDINVLLKLHDKFLHLYKMNVTAVIPGFHVRNKYSNMFQNYLDIGSEAISPKNQKQALDILTGKEGFIKTRFGKKISYEDIRQQMSAHGLMDSGYFTSELHQKIKSGELPKLDNYNLNPLDAEKFILYKLGRFFGGVIENQDKTVNFVANLKLGRSFTESAEHVNKFLFDYSDLTDFEMNVMRRIIPFYTWIRKNTPLQLEMMLEKPYIYRNLFKTLNTIESNVPDDMKIDREYLNDFAQDWIQLPGKAKNPEGRDEPLLWNPNLPYDDVDRFFNLLTPIESTKKLITQANPLIKMPIELGLNKHIFFDSPIERYPGHTVNMPGYLDPIGHIKGEPAQMSPKVRYVLDQIASLQALGKYVEKKGFDRTVHGINHLSGVKVMSYDYEKYKYYMLQERLRELEELKEQNNN